MYGQNMFSLLVLASAMPSLVTARPGRVIAAGGGQNKVCQNGKAIYTISNNAQNAVVAIPIAQDGSVVVAGGTSTATGGAGANGLTGANNDTAAPDALFSQSSLTIAGSNLFAVNAGSNTVSMFNINSRNPTQLTMVGKPVAVPGEFPVTVAASSSNNLVCVGMTGAKAGVSCAQFSARAGIGAMDTLRPFNLGQSTPPVGPLNTVSQVFFSDDQSVLFATVKGDPNVNNTGFLASFPVQNGQASCRSAAVSAQVNTNSPAGTAVLFGSSTIPGSTNLFVTDASFGAAVLSVAGAAAVNQLNANVLGKGVVDGQAATCWVAISPATNTAFVTDVGVNRLVEMSLTDATILGQPIDLSANGDPGLIDLRAAGNFIYALSPGNGTTQAAVTVLNAVTKKQVQHAQLTALGVSKNAQGMAVLV